jgi:hypothetical protein
MNTPSEKIKLVPSQDTQDMLDAYLMLLTDNMDARSDLVDLVNALHQLAAARANDNPAFAQDHAAFLAQWFRFPAQQPATAGD